MVRAVGRTASQVSATSLGHAASRGHAAPQGQAAPQGPEAASEALRRERGEELVNAVLGDGVKRLAASEKANYERTNRSLHALRDIPEGELITAEAVGVLRTEKILRPGLPPSWAEKVIGRRTRAFIAAGEGIRFEDC
jgi:sialic acid synthase SpsE